MNRVFCILVVITSFNIAPIQSSLYSRFNEGSPGINQEAERNRTTIRRKNIRQNRALREEKRRIEENILRSQEAPHRGFTPGTIHSFNEITNDFKEDTAVY